ncbi:MAG TPA: EutP/PduV family microcompartment system protein, partial [Symbiobacteriaceae bacterium]|nr:EutP/PduV family microcompartment system protein [Symbiobacteriaceae bacterium]
TTKPVMVLGRTGAGKTTLLHALAGLGGPVLKTQMVEFKAGTLDTPGEYAETPRFYHCLIASAMQAGVILVVQDATAGRPSLPPGFCRVFCVPVIGVVTKLDRPDARPELAEAWLGQYGVNGPYCRVSAVTGQGLDHLKQQIEHARGGCEE